MQARRLFNNFRGKIDRSEQALATIFNAELTAVLAEYDKQLGLARESGNLALVQALTQLRRAETRLGSFYDQGGGQITVASDEQYHVCPFCGYLAAGKVPDRCPICGAVGESFLEAE
jgi:rubrerythrin